MFYRSVALLEAGDVVEPGRWGRIILGMGVPHNLFFRELLFERIRRAEFPTLPSRMQSTYLFEDGVFAAQWMRAQNSTAELLYSVKPQNPDAYIGRFDMSWIDALNALRGTSFSEAEDIVRRYWHGDLRQNPQIEYLVPCPVVVTERLHPIPTTQVMRDCPVCKMTFDVVAKLTEVCPICRKVSFFDARGLSPQNAQ